MKSDSVREKILNAAVSLLKSFGIRKLAQPQIAKKAGVPQGHMTYYFPTRADLLMAVADRSLEQVAKIITKKIANSETIRSEDALMLVEPLIADVSRTRMLLGLLVESDENPALRKKLQENLDFSYSLIGLATGQKQDSIPTRLMSATILGLAIQEFLNSNLTKPEANLSECLTQMKNFISPKTLTTHQ